ncbi:unnamed protein product [Trichobilharzia szidati]|nr:unnamed protein product [Trichobilharzia szidati]
MLSSCVDDVVYYLELAEHLFAEQTKFNKDAALGFQSMLHTLIRCKDRLAQFVDELWCRWIILELPSKQKDVTPFSNINIPYPSSIHEQVESNDFFSFSFNACLPSVDQMEKALNNPNSLFDSIFYRLSSDNDDLPATSPLCGKSSVLASLKILAKPGLICQLLRIIEALKESKTRIYELFNQIWTYIFKPWLKKVPCVSGSEMGWPELKCQLINQSRHDKLDIDVSVNSTASSSNNRKKTASTAAANDDDNRGVLCYFNLLLIAPNMNTSTATTATTNISDERSAERVNNDSHNSRSRRKSTDIKTRRGSRGGVEGRRSEGEDKDEKEAAAKKLINSSCKQLSNAFSDLHKYFFGLKFIQSSNNTNNREENVGKGGVLDVNTDIDGDGNADDTAKRVIDLLINNNTIDNDIENSQPICCLFSHELVNELINGRFNADVFFTDHHGDDDDDKSINFESMSASITDSVRQLIHVGISTGFLSTEKQLSLNSTQQQQQVSSSNSGETKLSVWLNNLSLLKHKRKASCILEQLRQLLADRELFYSMCRPANESVKCEKKREQEEKEANPADIDHINAGDDDDDEGIFEEEEFILSDAGDNDNNNNNGPLKSRSSSGLNSASKYEHIVSRLLKSKCNLRDISRHLDLGQFDFPDCMVSETVLLMMKQVNDILNNCNVYLVALVNEVNQSKANNVLDLNTKKTNTIAFIEFIIKLIPRIFMLFTSLIPTLHADVAQTDLRFAVLYYNDCMYLAHECLTLSERGLYKFIQEFFDLDYETITNANDIVYDENILERSAAMSTCILVPHLRQSGVNSLLYHLRRERQHLLRCIERTQGFHDVSSSFGYSRCTACIDECCRHLLKIADVLASLPHTIYYRALGILCNCVCTELVKCILNLIDITKSDCDNILILLDKISSTVRELFVSGNEKTHLTVEASVNKSSQQVSRGWTH